MHPGSTGDENEIQMVALALAHLHRDIKKFERVYLSLSIHSLSDSLRGIESTEHFNIGFNCNLLDLKNISDFLFIGSLQLVLHLLV